MKKKIITLLALLAIIISCNTAKHKNQVLMKPDDVKADEYVINIDRDTTLETKNGALLKIPKGSLSTDKGSAVTLEIKEAYSLEQMIKAGLTTQSDGELLSSGGMIYINAKGRQNVKITQAIRVAIPADYMNPGMKLYKGKEDEGGNINWTDPSSLPENKQLTGIQQGESLFTSRCASCHTIGKDMTGPNLAHILKRFPQIDEGSWKYYEHGYYPFESHYDVYNIYKCNLLRMFGSVGTRFPADTSVNPIPDILRYIQNESDRRNLPLPAHAYLYDCADSCYRYIHSVASLKDQKEQAEKKKAGLVNENGPLVEEKKQPANPPGNNPPPANFDEKVSPKNLGAVYYQFTIETFGWFNIDMLIKGYDGVEESELFVRITGEYRTKTQVYLIIPSVKIYVQGGPAERNPEEFAFLYKNGKINLPQDTKAWIMAVSESESAVAFSLKEFTTGRKQEFDISLHESNKEEFNTAIGLIGGAGIKISVKDAKNAEQIRKTNTDLKVIDEELKKADGLKPKNCDCKCMEGRDSSTVVNTADIYTSK